MPFLHYSKKAESRCKLIEKKCHRIGWRSKIFYPERGYYKGTWEQNLQCGKGVQFLLGGYQYEGDWLDNKKHGFGVLSKYNLGEKLFDLVYIGDYRRNMKHGYGCLHYECGNIYEGDFKFDKKHGYGKCWYADGSYYEGQWIKDLQHGYGMIVQADGNRYEGEFQYGYKNGAGEFFHLNTSQKQIGFWQNGVCTTSTMEDIKFRQTAIFPTPYPIPKSELHLQSPCISFIDDLKKNIQTKHDKFCNL